MPSHKLLGKLTGLAREVRKRTSCFPGASPPPRVTSCRTSNSLKYMADPARFELTTSAFGGQRSIQLSYGSTRGRTIPEGPFACNGGRLYPPRAFTAEIGGGALDQALAVDLVGAGERQLGHEPHRTWMGIGRAVVEREAAQLILARLGAGLGHHEGDRQLVLDLVGHRHDADLGHVGMLAQQLLDLAGIDVLAAALEHVVGTADEEHEAVLVAPHHVARVVPAVELALPESRRS